jgi:hypothetical protein
MPAEKVNDENAAIYTEAYYEQLASQEELYLEEMEEEVRAILISYVSPASQNYRSTGIEVCGEIDLELEVRRSTRDSLDKQLVEAAEELITGDSDDPPLRDGAVTEMLRITEI